MPKGKAAAIALPANLKFETIGGQKFVEIKAAAQLAGVHPVVLEMAQRLLKDTSQGGRFVLGDRKMEERAGDIEQMFRAGLKQVAKAMGQRLGVRSHKDGNALVFWYDASGPGLHSKRKSD